MTRRANGQFDDAATTQFESVEKTDAFLDALARGEDPSGGTDPLAGLFLQLRDEVEQPMPAAPQVSQAPQLLTIDGGVNHPKRTPMNPWAAGFIGAAAASALLVGAGAALFNATPDSPLWGPSTTVFKDRTAAIELASTLEEIEVASQAGDADYLAQLVTQARALVDSMAPAGNGAEVHEDGVKREERPIDASRTVTVTVTVTPTEAAPQPPGSTQPVTSSSAAPTSPQPSRQAPSPSPQPQSSQQTGPAQQPGHSGQTNTPAPSSSQQPQSQQPQQSGQPAPQPSQANSQNPSAQPEVEPNPQGQPSQVGQQPQVQTIQPVHRSNAPAPQVVPANPTQP